MRTRGRGGWGVRRETVEKHYHKFAFDTTVFFLYL